MTIYHVHASNMTAHYRLGDFECESESEAIAFARRDLRRRNWGMDILEGLQLKAFPHRPGRTCQHEDKEHDGQAG